MNGYKITCSECDEVVHGWSKREAREKFREHVRAEHAGESEVVS